MEAARVPKVRVSVKLSTAFVVCGTLDSIIIDCRADADLSLLSRGLPPVNAFEDKVVWITGASQVLHYVISVHSSCCMQHTMLLKAIAHAQVRTGIMLHKHNATPDLCMRYSLSQCGELLATAESVDMNTVVQPFLIAVRLSA